MIKEGKIGVQEVVCLVTITICNQIFFTAPTIAAQHVGTAVWYMALISCIVSILAFAVILLLLKRFPGHNILEVYDISFGQYIGFVFSLVYSVSFLAASGVLLREFADILRVYVLPTAPIEPIVGIFIFTVAIAALLGLEAIARFAKLAGYICLAGFISILALSAGNYDFSNIYPIFGHGLGITIWEGVTRSSIYSEVILVAVFAGSLQGMEHIKKIGYISLVLSGVILSTSLLCVLLVFSYPAMEEFTAPMYTLTREIVYGAFIQRLDPLFVFLWNTTSLIAISILFYASVSIFCKTFRLDDARPVVPPLAVLLFAIALLPRDISSLISSYIEQLRYYAILLFYILPLFALIAAVIRKKRGVKKDG